MAGERTFRSVAARAGGTVLAAILLLNAAVAGAESGDVPPDPGPIPALPAAKAQHARLLDVAAAGSRLVAVGEEGVILASDGGDAWSQAPSPSGVMLTRVKFVDDRHGWALGEDATILETDDAGRSWTLRHRDPAGRVLYDAIFLDARRGLAVGGYGTVLGTDDGGRTWTPRESALTEAGMHLNALLRLGDGTLLAVGERGFMARSRDGGREWSVLDSPYEGSFFGAIPRGEGGALVFGMRGHVYVAADVAACATMPAQAWDPYGRATVDDLARLAKLGWRAVANGSKESLFGALPTDDGGALLVGAGSTVLRIDRDATAAAHVDVPAGDALVKLARSGGRIYAVGRRGVRALDEVAK